MSLTEQIEADVRNLYEIVFRLLRVGVVNSANPAKGTVRVRFSDQSSVITWDCHVLYPKTLNDKAYWMPDIGEHVAILSLPYGSSQGLVIGALYSRPDKTPVSDQDKWHVLFADGTYLEYDRKNHTLSGHIKGKVDGLTVDESAVIDVGGDVAETVGGSVTAEIGKNLSAQVGQNAEVSAGAQITLNAPLIKLLGNLSSAGAGGGAATETKEADTEHTGSYTLNGDLEVAGSIHATGDIIADGANVNHHSH